MRVAAMIAVAAIGAAGCGGADRATVTSVTPADTVQHPVVPVGPNAAMIYFTAALDTIQLHSIRRHEIDWPAFRATALARVRGSYTTPFDVYPAIRSMILDLGDHHSQFIAATGSSALAAGDPPTALRLTSNLNYIAIPSISETGSAGNAIADQFQTAIEAIDTDATCGWIVDLRGNDGGNMWPMLAGIGPVLGESDPVGYFVDPDSVRQPWYYIRGIAGYKTALGSSVGARVSRPYYTLRRPGTPVAVLQNGLTASSAEAVLIAFRGRDNTRTFGQASWGVPTANVGYRLSDGSTLLLTVSADADRKLATVYRDTIFPDVAVPGPTRDPASSNDLTVSIAKDWLLSQPACTP